MGGVSWKVIAGVVLGYVLAAIVGGVRGTDFDITDVSVVAAGLASLVALVFLFRAANSTGDAAWEDLLGAGVAGLVATCLWSPTTWAGPVALAAVLAARWFRRAPGAS